MTDLNPQKINRLIAEFEQQGNKAKILALGYRTYAQLFADDHFFAKVALLHKAFEGKVFLSC